MRCAALVALALLAAGGQAQAFVRSTTQNGTAELFWKESCVPVTIYVNGFDTKTAIPQDDIVKSVAAAAHAWGTGSVTCDGADPTLEIVTMLSPAAGPGPIGYDARNSLVFRTDNWTVGGKPLAKPYASEALAVTTVISRGDGHIVDADMEINGVSKQWINLDPDVMPPGDPHTGGIDEVFDIQNTITHEFGHLIGLDHSCFKFDASNPKLRPKDDMGRDVPDCGNAPGDVQVTTMFDSADVAETSKRTLAADDERAVCSIYPPTRQHEACSLDTTLPGCAVAPARPSRGAIPRAWGLAVAAALVAGVVGARRRARR